MGRKLKRELNVLRRLVSFEKKDKNDNYYMNKLGNEQINFKRYVDHNKFEGQGMVDETFTEGPEMVCETLKNKFEGQEKVAEVLADKFEGQEMVAETLADKFEG